MADDPQCDVYFPPVCMVGSGSLECQPEVLEVKRKLNGIGIFLDCFDITVKQVYSRPQPYGFDFECSYTDRRRLLAIARSKPSVLKPDDASTMMGHFYSLLTNGVGYRQVGAGPQLHLEIGTRKDDPLCNAHVDSHGPVDLWGHYDFNQSMQHGYWDIGGDKLPGLYGSFGTRGQIGPLVLPLQGVDGKFRWIFGAHIIW